MNHACHHRPTLSAAARSAKSAAQALGPFWCALVAALTQPTPAHAAADGCKVLLCLAAPRWQDIPPCVPPIHQLMHDLALGKPFPICPMAGQGSGSDNTMATAPGFCPPPYTKVFVGESQTNYSCDYTGAVSVWVDGALFTRTWWDLGGGTVTEFTPAAKARLGQWDTRFDDDFAAWLGQQALGPKVQP